LDQFAHHHPLSLKTQDGEDYLSTTSTPLRRSKARRRGFVAHHHPSSTPSFARNARRRGSFVHLSVSTQEEGQTSSPFVHYVSTHGGGVTPPFVHLRFDASGGSIRPLSEQRVRFDARRNATSSPLFTSVSTPGGGISLPISLCSPPFRRQ